MNDLRLILLLLGLAIIAGLYLRERLMRRRGESLEDTEPDTVEDPDFNLVLGNRQDDDVSPFISALKRDTTDVDSDNLEPLLRTNRDKGADDEESAGGPIIILHVVATEDKRFRGPDILRAARRQGMKFGNMRIFHHHGIGDMRTSRPLFYLANMVEPGEFDLDTIADLRTRGLTLFMQVPTPLNAQVVLDLMLNTATRMAEELGGRVLTQDRLPLTDDSTMELYNRVDQLVQGNG